MRAYRTVVASALADVPQGARGYQTLAVVVRGDQQNQLALATYLGIERTVMTYLIDDLVSAGLVERRLTPADRGKPRRTRPSLTETGPSGRKTQSGVCARSPAASAGERLVTSDETVGFVPHDVLGVGLRMAVLRRSGSGSLKTSRRLRRIRSTATVLCTDGPSGWLAG
ncbi:MarR family winged helix-turn-helix transcriptional regulator [Streptomyces violascens]|uniref:MarR family winged helix-turn-helix transcriptional regulator n=1 Tax=Streptomyces violascens TaxID=67381 RepID=UPI00365E813E